MILNKICFFAIPIILVLVYSTAYAGKTQEMALVLRPPHVTTLDDGRKIDTYYAADLPKEMHFPKACNIQAYHHQSFDYFPSGEYSVPSDNGEPHIFRVLDGCVYPKAGEDVLKDGTPVFFYQTHPFFHAAYINGKFIKEGHFTLKNGDTFDVENGDMPPDVGFDNGHLVRVDTD